MKTFKVFHSDYAGKEPILVNASDEYDAAEKYAGDYDCEGDYTVVQGHDLELEIECPEGNRKAIVVSGESVAQYTARNK